ncbi:ABC transporter permease [Spirochaeta lutea]|uniref:ABC transporter permease n=1 Tax=Spirochaeta lutea TaxID=1480694 RepID=UPI00068D7796|nr:ABC transporter permease [Spirochaeta lutea]
MPGSIKTVLHRTISLGIMILLWKLVSLGIVSSALPPPEAVFARAVLLTSQGRLIIHSLATLGRTLAGVGIASLFALPLGILSGRKPLADTLMTPGFYILFPVPKIALLPVLFLLFGIGELSRVLIVALVLFFQIVLAIRDAAKGIPRELIETFTTMGGRGLKKVTLLLIPAILPAFFTALRIGIGTALAVLFFAETFFTRHGLGFFTMDAWMRIDYLDMYAGILGLSVLGWILFGITDLLQKRYTRADM